MSVMRRIAFAILAVLACGSIPLVAWSPGTGSPNAVGSFSVDTTNRYDVLSFYNTVYAASQGYAIDMQWTGSILNNIPGTTSLTFKNDVLRRVNFYRALVGMSASITFNDTESSEDQFAAIIFSANGILTHFPTQYYPADATVPLTDWTQEGYNAAGTSNIALGYYGPNSIDAYMTDGGDSSDPNANSEVGHRRWILYSQASVMGTGDIPPNSTYEAANALYNDTTQAFSPPQFNKWPNAGYCPFPLMPARWSVSCPHADFTEATVTMTQGSTSIPCQIINADSDGSQGGTYIGDNTLAWEPSSLPTALTGDTTYTVTISGIFDDNTGNGNQFTGDSISYTVTLFDPNNLNDSVGVTGSSSPPVTGASYTFNPIQEADAYDLQVSTGSTAAWNEGAETSPAPQIVSDTTGSYADIQSAVVHSGSKAFQLAFPSDLDGSGNAQAYDFSDQSFQVTRTVIPTSTSKLQFYDLCRFVITTSTLSAQVSTDNGTTWTQVWSRAGVVPSGGNTSEWDQAYLPNNVDLSSYAGQPIIVRFVLSANGERIFPGTTSSYGFFIDDITVTNATQLVNPTDTTLASNATSFTLNTTTAGSQLQLGTTYYVRVRPEVGLKWYGFGAPELVVPTTSTTTGFANWISTTYPTITQGVTGDDSGDGISNGLKYAFGLDPTAHNSPGALPLPQVSGSNLVLSYAANVPGVTYAAEWSNDLNHWTALTDTGTSGNHVFSTSISGQAHVFMRNKITVSP